MIDITFDAASHGEGIDDDGWKHRLWRVTLTHQGRTYSTDYRMGVGLVDLQPITPARAARLRNEGKDVRWNAFGPGKDALATPSAPTLRDVLQSLQSDCQAGDQMFEDFCDDFGYNTDSRKAYATWEACRTAYLELRKLFGASFGEFLNTDWEEGDLT